MFCAVSRGPNMGKSNRETQRFYLRTKVVPANNGPNRNGPRENALCAGIPGPVERQSW